MDCWKTKGKCHRDENYPDLSGERCNEETVYFVCYSFSAYLMDMRVVNPISCKRSSLVLAVHKVGYKPTRQMSPYTESGLLIRWFFYCWKILRLVSCMFFLKRCQYGLLICIKTYMIKSSSEGPSVLSIYL